MPKHTTQGRMSKRVYNATPATGKAPAVVAPLPVPLATAAALPMLTEHAQLVSELDELVKGLEGEQFRHGEDADAAYWESEQTDRQRCLERFAPEQSQLVARWRAVDQPVTCDQITAEVLRLLTAMPTANNVDKGVLAETLSDDIAELRPTAFVLARAARAHRLNSKFFNESELVKEIRRQKRKAAQYRQLLQRDLAQELEQLLSGEEDEAAELQHRISWVCCDE